MPTVTRSFFGTLNLDETYDRPMNPYAAPRTVDTHGSPRQGAAKFEWSIRRLFALIAFLFLRIGASIFASMIALVHFSGTVVHWHNVVPMLAGLALLLITAHLIERWLFRNAKTKTKALVFRIACFSYVAGVIIALVLGLFNSFPTPYT